MAREYPADEVWVGAAPRSLAVVPPDAFKAIALHARARRLRLHTHLPATASEQEIGRAHV